MKKSMMFAALLCGVLMVGGCGGPKLDTSSEAAFKKSVEEISKTLDAAKREKFESAIGTLMLSKVMMSGGAGDEASMQKKVAEVFGGKSVDEIIAEGEKAQEEAKKDIEKMMK